LGWVGTGGVILEERNHEKRARRFYGERREVAGYLSHMGDQGVRKMSENAKRGLGRGRTQGD